MIQRIIAISYILTLLFGMDDQFIDYEQPEQHPDEGRKKCKNYLDWMKAENLELIVVSLAPEEIFTLSTCSKSMKKSLLKVFTEHQIVLDRHSAYEILKAKSHDFYMPNFAVESSFLRKQKKMTSRVFANFRKMHLLYFLKVLLIWIIRL